MAFIRRPHLESLEDRFTPAVLSGAAHLPGWGIPSNPATGAIALAASSDPSAQALEIRWDGGGADHGTLHPHHPFTLVLRDAALTGLVQPTGEEASLPIEDRVFANGNGFLAD
jgi:hypothetical protein